jgi:hypothetical protein
MGFASTYLKERALFPEFIKEAPSEATGIIAVVPSYSEPDVTDLLDSLAQCHEPACKAEVLIIINAPANADPESLENNIKSIRKAESWKKNHPDCFFQLFIIDVTSCKIDRWGVGSARKTGMDEAVRRFNYIDNPEGVILSLDADCTVEKNYFTTVHEELAQRKDRSGCSIYFEHQVSGTKFPDSVYRSIILYELHLRYYFQGLAFSGFPYVHHTVGSAIAVKSLPYIKVGGMNRKMAGEDFYFIKKLVPSGRYFNLNRTAIFPSPRLSFRVPFGTGPALTKMAGGETNTFFSYNIQAFKELKALFGLIDRIFYCQPDDPEFLYSDLPPGIKQLTKVSEWADKIREIKSNTSGIQSFRKRFFGWFDMFRIVKYMNSVHLSLLKKKPVVDSAAELLVELKKELVSKEPRDMLEFYRKLEKQF